MGEEEIQKRQILCPPHTLKNILILQTAFDQACLSQAGLRISEITRHGFPKTTKSLHTKQHLALLSCPPSPTAAGKSHREAAGPTP